jgi:hypothetical protein
VNAWSRVGLELIPDSPSVKQGEIAVGRLVVKKSDGQSILGGLKGKNLGKTLYLLHVSPFMGKQGHLESEAKFIFLAIPQANNVSEVINGEEVLISWDNIEIIPTEPPKSFLLGNFEIPARRKIVQWLLIILGTASVLGFIFYFNKFYSKSKKSKIQLDHIKKQLMDCKTYDDIVMMWGRKHDYLTSFPKLEQSYKNFEQVLFKYQFKPQIAESEIMEVIAAYNKFKTSAAEVINAK